MSTPATPSKNAVQKLTFSDICLERASMATKGPWVKWKGHYEVFAGMPSCNNPGTIKGYTQVICEIDELGKNKLNNTKFIASSRTDVPELARRLKRACKLLRTASIIFAEADGGWAYKINEIADELEALPEDEK